MTIPNCEANIHTHRKLTSMYSQYFAFQGYDTLVCQESVRTMMKPTTEQTKQLYEVAHWLTEYLKVPITIVRIDERPPHHLYIQFGIEDERFFLITMEGEVLSND